jgi:hypothetical protein
MNSNDFWKNFRFLIKGQEIEPITPIKYFEEPVAPTPIRIFKRNLSPDTLLDISDYFSSLRPQKDEVRIDGLHCLFCGYSETDSYILVMLQPLIKLKSRQ